MTPEQIEKKLKDLARKLCCIESSQISIVDIGADTDGDGTQTNTIQFNDNGDIFIVDGDGVVHVIAASGAEAFAMSNSSSDDALLSLGRNTEVLSGVTFGSGLYAGTGNITYTTSDYGSTASNDWEEQMIFIPTTTISGQVGMGIINNQLLHNLGCNCYVNMSTNQVTLTNGGSAWTQNASIIPIVAGNVIKLRVTFAKHTMRFEYNNLSNGDSVVLESTQAFGTVLQPTLLSHNSGAPAIILSAATDIDIKDWKFLDNSRGRVAWIVQSIGEGYSASSHANTYISKLNADSNWKIARYGKAGMGVRDLIVNKTIEGALLSNPDVIVLDGIYGNDFFSGQSAGDTQTRLASIRDKIAALGIPVIWLGITNNGSITAFKNTMDAWIQDTYPEDLFFDLNTYLSGSWVSADGAHPNDTGHTQLYNGLLADLPFMSKGLRVLPERYDRIPLFQMPLTGMTNAIEPLAYNGAMAAATITEVAGVDNIVVGAGSFDSFFRTTRFFTTYPLYQHLRIKVKALGAAPVVGIRLLSPGLPWINFINAQGYVYINLLTGAATSSLTGHTTSDYNSFTGAVAVDEVIDVWFEWRYNDKVTLRVMKGDIELSSRSLVWAATNFPAQNSTYSTVILADGTYQILKYEVGALGTTRPKIGFLGDSGLAGAQLLYKDLIEAMFNAQVPGGVVNFAVTAMNIAGMKHFMKDILQIKPKVMLLSAGIEASFNGWANPAHANHAVWAANWSGLIDSLIQAGIEPMLMLSNNAVLWPTINTTYALNWWTTNYPTRKYVLRTDNEGGFDGTGFHFNRAANRIFTQRFIKEIKSLGLL